MLYFHYYFSFFEKIAIITLVILMKKKFFVVLTLIWMIVIFAFSAQEASVSSDTSSYVLQVIVDKLSINVEYQDPLWQPLIFLLRKSAHILEYMILTFFAYGALEFEDKRILKTIGIVFLYACSDEIHQLFVMGRSGSFIDVLVDMIGVMVALLILKVMRMLKKKEGM